MIEDWHFKWLLLRWVKIRDSDGAVSSQTAWILRNLAVRACILHLLAVPISQLALICTLKGGKYDVKAGQMNGWPAAIWTALWNYLLICLFRKQFVLYLGMLFSRWRPLPLRSAVCWAGGARVGAPKGWLAAAGRWNCTPCPSPPRLAVCTYQRRSSPSSDTGKVLLEQSCPVCSVLNSDVTKEEVWCQLSQCYFL